MLISRSLVHIIIFTLIAGSVGCLNLSNDSFDAQITPEYLGQNNSVLEVSGNCPTTTTVVFSYSSQLTPATSLQVSCTSANFVTNLPINNGLSAQTFTVIASLADSTGAGTPTTYQFVVQFNPAAASSPSPSPTLTPAPTPTPTAAPNPTATSSPVLNSTPTPAPTATPTLTPPLSNAWSEVPSSLGQFNSTAVDSAGNIYVTGGTAVTSGGLFYKFDKTGAVLWNQISSCVVFGSLTTDSSNNVYVVGASLTTNCSLGNGVTLVTSAYGSPFLAKFNSAGQAQWGITPPAFNGDEDGGFASIAVDTSGNIFVGGDVECGSYNFGNGLSVNITCYGTGNYQNFLLLKYNSAGVAQWVHAGTNSGYSYAESLAVDSSGDVYMAGTIGWGPVNFGNGISKTTASISGLLVKFNGAGVAQWALTDSSATYYNSIALDTSGSVYVVGYDDSTVTKYDSQGNLQWNTSPVLGQGATFESITIDSKGNIFVAGNQGYGSYNFGNGVVTSGASTSGNVMLVEYNSSGIAQFAQTTFAGTSVAGGSSFSTVGVDNSGNIYAAGSLAEGSYNFGNSSVTCTNPSGFSGPCAVLVKY